MNVTEIKNPQFLKSLSIKECDELARDIRSFLLQSVSKTGGHLSSNLGIVELTIALHKVFDAPRDRILFDVGHQSYVHKILTGRAGAFATLRQYHGLSGFQKRTESEYDCWEAGHSSTSLSAALGMAVARDLKHESYEVIPVIGDGSMTGGMALEALNNIGGFKKDHKLIIIFNDNNMSISSNVGGLSNAFSKLRSSEAYLGFKREVKGALRTNKAGQTLLKGMTNVRDSIKKEVMQDSIFKEYGLDYLGPIDGHDFHELLPALTLAKNHKGSIVIHVVTKKGKGYAPAEQDRLGKWHGVGKFDVKAGRPLRSCPPQMASWSSIMCAELCRLGRENQTICAITPAMLHGSALEPFQQAFPSRTFDCGIAEQHAMTFAAGLAINGMHPFISVYSSFLQRAYDQIHHDVARMDLPVIIGIDRCGLVGEDGSTHQGIYDISFMNAIPNLILSQPKDAYEARCLLYTASIQNHPFAIRYPRGETAISQEEIHPLPIGSWVNCTNANRKTVLITYGPQVDRLVQKVTDNNLDVDIVNARFFKPLDEAMLLQLANSYQRMYIYETDCEIGGLAASIICFYNRNGIHIPIHTFGIHDHFVEHGSIPELRKQEGIDTNTVLTYLEQDINTL